jgi:hypothetical protein
MTIPTIRPLPKCSSGTRGKKILINIEVIDAPLDYNILFGQLHVHHASCSLFHILDHALPPQWEDHHY